MTKEKLEYQHLNMIEPQVMGVQENVDKKTNTKSVFIPLEVASTEMECTSPPDILLDLDPRECRIPNNSFENRRNLLSLSNDNKHQSSESPPHNGLNHSKNSTPTSPKKQNMLNRLKKKIVRHNIKHMFPYNDDKGILPLHTILPHDFINNAITRSRSLSEHFPMPNRHSRVYNRMFSRESQYTASTGGSIYEEEKHYSDHSSSSSVGVGHTRKKKNKKKNPTQHNELEEESLNRFWPRVAWLVVLLVIQSLSSVILQGFENLVVHHPLVVYFLTVLVGSAGNAGSQSTVLVIRGLATGKYRRKDYPSIIIQQLYVGIAAAAVLFVVSFLRTYFFEGDSFEVLAVCVSMFVLVVVSVVLGTTMPMFFKAIKIDPAHAGAAIQVITDIIGVTLVCSTSHVVLNIIAPIIDAGYLKRHTNMTIKNNPPTLKI